MKKKGFQIAHILLICFTSSMLLMSCKSKAILADAVVQESKEVAVENEMTSKKIIQNHYGNKSDFSTLYIKSSANYTDDKNSQTVSAEIKIKRNEKILISIRVLGMTMAKALITPNEVKYYEKINGTYFDGDYQKLSQWLGTDLNFSKVQNMLVGQPIDDLTKEKYNGMLSDNLYKISTFEDNIDKSFFFDIDRFLLKKQEFVQQEKERKIEVNYAGFQDFASAILPVGLLINAAQKKGATTISIEYNSVIFNEELSFPYSVPNGYERISIN